LETFWKKIFSKKVFQFLLQFEKNDELYNKINGLFKFSIYYTVLQSLFYAGYFYYNFTTMDYNSSSRTGFDQTWAKKVGYSKNRAINWYA